ncbi:hypothetical protein FN846DRAFT_985448 [Sphaerosporella brunnea]|uniref:Uncharacterized protein n=1 Tax=Sphaerosporella brunnea TaxID=1250544 RepID=A0A5J5ETJ3_9PEZI|nr:hypothetical protein FN846DRAFT_985448 [Sphaerosporella brunnea]
MTPNNTSSTALTLEPLPFDIHVELLATILSTQGIAIGHSYEWHLLPLLVASPNICLAWDVSRSAILHRVAAEQLASIKDDALTLRRRYVRVFFRFKVWQSLMRLGHVDVCVTYRHLDAVIRQHYRAWEDSAGICIAVWKRRFWLAPVYNPPTLEWSQFIRSLGAEPIALCIVYEVSF